jgi:hypothetical protein
MSHTGKLLSGSDNRKAQVQLEGYLARLLRLAQDDKAVASRLRFLVSGWTTGGVCTHPSLPGACPVTPTHPISHLTPPSHSPTQIKDVIEMSKNKWVPRRETFTAKKLDEVHAEAEAELGIVSSKIGADLPALPGESGG